MRFKDIRKIIKNHDLRLTDGRIDILTFFMNSSKALSVKDVEINFKDLDRVTLYRTLNTFEEHGILHKIPDEGGSVVYGLCYDTCDCESHHHNHIHFKCQICQKIECLDLKIPSVSVPGYVVSEANLILNGICLNCNESEL